MADENMTATEMEASQAVEQQAQTEESKQYSQDEVANLMKALKSEREARKTYERQIKEKEQQLEKFAEINPSEYQKLQADAARASASAA